MFNECNSLININLSNFKTNKNEKKNKICKIPFLFKYFRALNIFY